MFGWRAGVFPARVFFGVSGAGFCPDGDQAIASYREFVSGDRHLQSVVQDRRILTCLPVCLEGGADLCLAIARHSASGFV